MGLRLLAVAAPDRVSGTPHVKALASRDPASLFNACRHAAWLASRSKHSAWSNSNWNASRESLRETFLLMHSLDDMPDFLEIVQEVRPNLLLIGAMTICLPGAIACAVEARRLLDESVFIVLGGRHASETIYLSKARSRADAFVMHHPSSPLNLAHKGEIPDVFDLIVAGDGEHIIAEVGEAVATLPVAGNEKRRKRTDVLGLISPEIPGDWIAGAVAGEAIETVVSAGNLIDYDKLPSPALMFGVSGGFDIFRGCKTAHVFSDTGRGCVYDCSFCSERKSVAGGLKSLEGAARRLHRQLVQSRSVIEADSPGWGASAFVEDSVLLAGSPRLIDAFIEFCRVEPPHVQFGAQLTIDLILRRRDHIAALSSLGLRYLFVGIETLIPGNVGGMSKDLASRSGSWMTRVEAVLELCAALDIKVGAALLFGLGESQQDRLQLLEVLRSLRMGTGNPSPISLNWAVQHPLCGDDGGANYKYTQWGVPPGRFSELLSRYGEASTLYPVGGLSGPRLEDLEEIEIYLKAFDKPPPTDQAGPSALVNISRTVPPGGLT